MIPKSLPARRAVIGICWASALGAVMLLSACTSAPAPRLHSLIQAPSPSVMAPSSDKNKVLIDLAPVSVPASVDQPQWLVRTNDGSLRLLEQERWASGLRDEIGAALRHELTNRWGAVDVKTSAAPTAPSWRVRVDVLRFELVAGHSTWLQAAWSITHPNHPQLASPCQQQWQEEAQNSMISMAQAQQRALIKLADQIGSQLQRLQSGQAGSCT